MKNITHYLFFLICIFQLNSAISQNPANVITDGNARFTVLTPTLIRTEYSGDGIFENRKSFNITNLDLPATSYTTTVNDGWREIQTDKTLLRYKQNSGVFDSTNLIVEVNYPDRQVIGKPWGSTILGYREEAENANLQGGAKIATDHIDYDGTGFVAGLKYIGASLEWAPDGIWSAGDYMLSFKYSNGMGADKTISLYIDNVKTQLTLPKTTNWDAWSTFQKKITLDSKPHIFKLSCDDGDTYNINIDFISVAPIVKIGQIGEAEFSPFSGKATRASDHLGFSGTGFVASLKQAGPYVLWNINNNLAAGEYSLVLKYSNGIPADGQLIPRTLSLYVDNVKTQITFPPTTDWETWGYFKKTIMLAPGEHVVRLSCDAGDTYNVNVDWLALTTVDGDIPKENIAKSKANLGAWSRGLDEKRGSIPLWDGILSRDGWFLLDDSQTALNDLEWVVDRTSHEGGYQDGYVFAYGDDYQTGLKDFYKITGNPVMLPKWAFGVWYSINDANYTTSTYYQNTLLPQLRSEKVPLDVLVIDTDWKAPYRWNSWDWNTTAFPDPTSFFQWTKTQGLVTTLNLHPTIQSDDAKFTTTNTTAGGLINKSGRYHFDFTNKKHAQAYFDLHKPFNDLGVRFWWFDQAELPNSVVKGVPADTWINGLYAKEADSRNLRGFAFSRIGSGHAGYSDGRKPGIAWSEHRYTVHFTGDTYNTWDMLAFQSTFSVKEGNIGIPYVTHDLGSYHGSTLSDDMYMRWVQQGTFQPIFRLHSKQGKRLPWQYPNVSQYAKDFIRLRHALVPYTYTLAHESANGGLPIVRGMYLYYPTANEAYSFDKQYLYGEKILVAPIASAGTTASVQMWFPEGKWTNFFTNETITGPLVQTVSFGLNSMPAYVKAGGIIPLAPYSDFVGQIIEDQLTLKVFGGDNGDFILYDDEGENLNYRTGKYTQTKFIYKDTERTFTIKAQEGSFTGAPVSKSYNIELYNTAVPQDITLNGLALNKTSNSTEEGWFVTNNVIYLHLNKRSVNNDAVIAFNGFETATKDHKGDLEFKMFPNPTSKQFSVALNASSTSSATLNMYTTTGNLVLSKILHETKTLIDIDHLQRGIYVVKVKQGNISHVERLVIN